MAIGGVLLPVGGYEGEHANIGSRILAVSRWRRTAFLAVSLLVVAALVAVGDKHRDVLLGESSLSTTDSDFSQVREMLAAKMASTSAPAKAASPAAAPAAKAAAPAPAPAPAAKAAAPAAAPAAKTAAPAAKEAAPAAAPAAKTAAPAAKTAAPAAAPAAKTAAPAAKAAAPAAAPAAKAAAAAPAAKVAAPAGKAAEEAPAAEAKVAEPAAEATEAKVAEPAPEGGGITEAKVAEEATSSGSAETSSVVKMYMGDLHHVGIQQVLVDTSKLPMRSDGSRVVDDGVIPADVMKNVEEAMHAANELPKYPSPIPGPGKLIGIDGKELDPKDLADDDDSR